MYMLTVYWIAFAPARKPYWIELLFTREKVDLDAVSDTERSCATPSRRVGT